MYALILLKGYIVFLLFVMLLYILRHLIFSINRISGQQRINTQDIVDADLPTVTVLVPMHNEEKVARHILGLLTAVSYPEDKLEIMPINDHSTDATGKIIDEFAARFPSIHPLHRSDGGRGKPAALNVALKQARGEIIIVFDADYQPARGLVREMAIAFKDPEVGAVMGRVVPGNTRKKLLTKLLSLERSAGYQVDQQARHNMKLIPQYGGTVGGFRRELMVSLGGFSPDILAEDTELTFLFVINGWKVFYSNRTECYEEVPEDWDVRARQLKRWSHGHTQVLLRYLVPMLRSPYLVWKEKLDGVLLLFLYVVPVLLIIGTLDVMILFFLNEAKIFESVFLFLAVAGFNVFGNFAPFYQIGTASILDGFTYRIRLLPFMLFNSLFNIVYTSQGSLNALAGTIFKRKTLWEKTERYRSS
jgi:cellulose synthase/poly-beta-1,6-N-acetylglucosamine synthase-like glycosyltransferase